MKGKRMESEMHTKASKKLEEEIQKDLEVEDPTGKSLAELIDDDEDTEKHD